MLNKEDTAQTGGMQKDADRRKEKRLHWLAYCDIFGDGDGLDYPASLTAIIHDISKNGLRINYIGKPVAPCSAVNIKVESLKLQRSAKIIWSKTINMDNTAGLQLMEPIPMPSAGAGANFLV